MDVLKLEDEDVEVRSAAAKALIEPNNPIIDEALFSAENDRQPKVRSAANLVLALRLNRKMNDVRNYALMGIRDKNETIRDEAAKTLGLIMSTDGADLLITRLEDRNESQDIRISALESLKGLRLDSSLLLFRLILTDKAENAKLRAKAALALGEAEDSQALEMLINISKDDKEPYELRQQAEAAVNSIAETKH